MAGIGFNLQKLLQGNTYTSTLKAYFYSTLIVAGPWLLSIFTIFILSAFIPDTIDNFEKAFFRTVIIYVFAYSLITIGIFHFPLTRYLADKLYSQETEALVPALNTTAVMLCGLEGILGLFFYVFTSGDPFIKLLTVMIFFTVSLMWLLMIFLTALRDYHAIAISYFWGTAVAIVGALYLGGKFGLIGYFIGYLLGHFVIVILWAARIFVEFPSSMSFDPLFIKFFSNNKVLIFIGFLYNLAIWIDKIVLWYSPQATALTEFFHVHLLYDSATFFAFITIIPALAIFLVEVETEFYNQYRRYYIGIIDKSSFAQIKQYHQDMVASLRDGIGHLICFQGMVTFLIIVFSPHLVHILRFSPIQIPVFRIAVLGAFLHSLLLLTLIIILYFDFKKLALVICLIFATLNGICTYITAGLDISFLGYGYTISAFITLVLAYFMLDTKIRDLEYYTFALQPVGIHREEGF